MKKTDLEKTNFELQIDHFMKMHKAGQMIGPIGDADENIIDLIKVFNMATNHKNMEDLALISNYCVSDDSLNKCKDETEKSLFIKPESLSEFFKDRLPQYTDRDRRGDIARDRMEDCIQFLRSDKIFVSKQHPILKEESYSKITFEIPDRADRSAVLITIFKTFKIVNHDDLTDILVIQDTHVEINKNNPEELICVKSMY